MFLFNVRNRLIWWQLVRSEHRFPTMRWDKTLVNTLKTVVIVTPEVDLNMKIHLSPLCSPLGCQNYRDQSLDLSHLLSLILYFHILSWLHWFTLDILLTISVLIVSILVAVVNAFVVQWWLKSWKCCLVSHHLFPPILQTRILNSQNTEFY